MRFPSTPQRLKPRPIKYGCGTSELVPFPKAIRLEHS